MNWNKVDKKLLAKCVLIPLAAGAAASLITRNGMTSFQTVKQPPLSPPAWLFPIVWTLLYVLMGVASYLIYTARGKEEDIRKALAVYGVQLAVNVLWPVFFFLFQWYFLSFLWLLLLLALVIVTESRFYKIVRLAGYFFVPYVIWLAFAGYLNLGVWWLNR